MTLQELFNITVDSLPFNVTRAVDTPELKTLELSKLQKETRAGNILYNLCNQLIWNHLLKTEALTPNDWGPTTLQEDVLAVPIGEHKILYKYHTITATPMNVLSFPNQFPEYSRAAKNIINKCKSIAPTALKLVDFGIDRDTALWFMNELHIMEELLWYETTT